ncbi:MAG: hypothetical protein ICV60_21655 [Pyrinomonadaceae bacterium]|nr:hypothetical protein [Pyrinomonadaceae bacterium]
MKGAPFTHTLSSLMSLARKSALLVALALCLIAFAALEASAQSCATPGKDGPGGSLTGVVNTYYPGNANAAMGATSITLGAPTGAAATITTGDLLLVIQMQDAQINDTNSSVYGDGISGDPGSGASAIGQSGLYEYVVATNNATTSVTIRGAGTGNGLVNSYFNNNATNSRGQRRFQVVRVPQYTSATLSSGLTALPWNGRTGGILAIDVSGALNLGSATVNVNGMGFRGGGARQLAGDSGGANTDYRNTTANTCHGIKGEGIAGTPHYVYDPSTLSVIDTGVEGYPSGATARGAPGNAGGGGTDGNPITNDQNSGGGGGGNGGVGGVGGNTWSSNLGRGGFGGGDFSSAAANRLIMGGGGGAGSRNNSSGTASSGGAGGGIVMIRAGNITGSGTITANGSQGSDAENDGAGGGGAGGSVLVVALNGGLGSLTVRAQGGDGGNAWTTQTAGGTPGNRHGPGGGGAGGVVALNGSASVSVTGGTRGTTTTSFDPYGATSGGSGQTLSITASQITGATAGASCSPYVGLTKSVSPTGTQIPGTDLTYTIAFSNTGGAQARNLVIIDPDPSTTLSLSTSTYFKVGSVTTSIVSTGLTMQTFYSNNGGSTYTYTPVSGGGGAPAGYDANVTHIRFQFTGNLSQSSTGNANSGSVSFKVRIK